jgi:hypothetical protein
MSGSVLVFGRRQRREVPHARLAGVQEAPRHEVAGSWAPASGEALCGFDVGADREFGQDANTTPLAMWSQALVSAIGIFLPSFLLVLILAPILARHRENANVQGFVKGAYAAAIGTILGACILLGKIAIGDWLTAAIGIISLAVLFPLEGQ